MFKDGVSCFLALIKKIYIIKAINQMLNKTKTQVIITKDKTVNSSNNTILNSLNKVSKVSNVDHFRIC